MIEVSKEKFQEVINKTPYTRSFLLGCSATRYNGKKGLFKDSCFAKHDDDKYYVHEAFQQPKNS